MKIQISPNFELRLEKRLFFRTRKVKIYWNQELLAIIDEGKESKEKQIHLYFRNSGESWKLPLKEFRDCLDKAEELLGR